jgi:hypothetical protein
MPTRKTVAANGVIAPDLDLEPLVEATDNFCWATRISYQDILKGGPDKFEELIHKWVVKAGKPLVVDGFDSLLEPWMFTPRWLRDNLGNKGLSRPLQDSCSDRHSRSRQEPG